MTTPFSLNYLQVGKVLLPLPVLYTGSFLPLIPSKYTQVEWAAQSWWGCGSTGTHTSLGHILMEPGQKRLVLGAAHSTNWEVQTRGKNAHFRGGITRGRKQMSLQCTVKHALLWSQQVLNVVFSVAPSSSPGIHRVPPPSCCTQSHPILAAASKTIPCAVQILVAFRGNGGLWTCPPVSPQCAERTQSSERVPVPTNETCTTSTCDSWFSLASAKLMGSFPSSPSPSLI